MWRCEFCLLHHDLCELRKDLYFFFFGFGFENPGKKNICCLCRNNIIEIIIFYKYIFNI